MRGKSLIYHLPENGWVLTMSILVLRAAVVSQVFEHMLLTKWFAKFAVMIQMKRASRGKKISK